MPVLIGVAAYRLWRLVALDTITDPIRDKAYQPDTWPDRLISCPWCLGTWLALSITFLARRKITNPWLVAASAAVVTGVTADLIGKLEER